MNWRNDPWALGKVFCQDDVLKDSDCFYQCTASHTAVSLDCAPSRNCLNGQAFWKVLFRCVPQNATMTRMKSGITIATGFDQTFTVQFQGATDFHTQPIVNITSSAGCAVLVSADINCFTYRVRPTSVGDVAPASFTVDWIAVAPMASGQTSILSTVGTASAFVGCPRTMVLTLVDADGVTFTKGGAAVTFTASISGGTAAPLQNVVDNGDGTYAVAYTPACLGTLTIGAAINNEVTLQNPLVLTVVQPLGSLCKAQWSNSVVEAQDTCTLTVSTYGTNSVPVSGALLSFTSLAVQGTAALGKISFGSIVDNLDGTYSVQCTAQQVGTLFVNVTIDGSVIVAQKASNLLIVAPGTMNPSLCKLITALTTIQQNSRYGLALQLFDTNGTPIPNAAAGLALIQSGTGLVSTDPSPAAIASDNGDGSYVVYITGKVAGTVRIGVSVLGVPINASINLTVLGPSTTLSTYRADKTSAYSTRPITLTAAVRDTANIPMSNMNVQFAIVTASSSTLIQAPVTNVGDGTYTLQYVSMTPGTVSFTAFVEARRIVSPSTLNVTYVAQIVPSAPSIGSVTAVASQATVSIVPPTNDGGSPVFSYLVRSIPVTTDITVTVVDPTAPASAVFHGFIGGTTYTFEAIAANKVGSSAASNPSAPVMIQTAPDAPKITSVTPGPEQVAVAFTPGPNGGSSVLQYTLTALPGYRTTVGTSAQPLVMTGLTDGLSYNFTLSATNAIGTSMDSAPSASVIPFTTPKAPLNLQITPGNGRVCVSFDMPASNGGSPILYYAMSIGGQTVKSADATTTALVAQGLTNGSAYTVSVYAVNAAGVGLPAQSPPDSPVVPFTAPSAPSITGVKTGDGVAYVSISSGNSNGRDISSYALRVIAAASAVTLQTQSVTALNLSAANNIITVSGLTNGTAYQFAVLETNIAGSSLEALSSTVVPIIPPKQPSISAVSVASLTSVLVTMNLPSDNGGSVVKNYRVAAINSDGSVYQSYTFAADPINPTTSEVTGLLNGNTYTIVVAAENQAGIGACVKSPSVFVAIKPSVPAITAIQILNGRSVQVLVSPPSVIGGAPLTGYTGVYGISGSGATSTFTMQPNETSAIISNLLQGNTYIFKLSANNSIGNSPCVSSSILLIVPPGSPTIVAAIASSTTSAIITVAAPDNGGSPITLYEVQSVVGGPWAPFPIGSLSCTVTGLQTGYSYNFSVRASNAAGTSIPFTAASPLKIMQVASPPTSVSATVESSTSAQVVVQPPVSFNGGNLLSYAGVYNGTSTSGDLSTGAFNIPTPSNASGPALATVAGLHQGYSYTFSVATVNEAGTSSTTTSSASLLLAVPPPTAPTVLSVKPLTVSSTQLTVGLPADNGGSPVIAYQVRYGPDGSFPLQERVQVDGLGTVNLTVPALTAGVTYNYSVAAETSVGTGVFSTANQSTLVLPSSSPASVTASVLDGTTVQVTVQPPANLNGGQITSYIGSYMPGNGTFTITPSADGTDPASTTIGNLTRGVSYTFSVIAVNAGGTSTSSTSTPLLVAVVPVTAPSITSVTPLSVSSVQISITPPSDNGGSPVTRYIVDVLPEWLDCFPSTLYSCLESAARDHSKPPDRPIVHLHGRCSKYRRNRRIFYSHAKHAGPSFVASRAGTSHCCRWNHYPAGCPTAYELKWWCHYIVLRNVHPRQWILRAYSIERWNPSFNCPQQTHAWSHLYVQRRRGERWWYEQHNKQQPNSRSRCTDYRSSNQ